MWTAKRLIEKKANLLLFPALCGLLLVLAFAFQGRRGIWQPDEGYYAGTAVTMRDRGSFLIPYLGEDEIFLDKPPMIYWGIMAGLKLFGHNEFGVRFVHGLCFALTSLAVGSLSFSMFGNRRLAFLSSAVYATMVVPFVAASFVTPDALLALWTTVAALCFWNSVKSEGRTRILWQMLLCGAVGLGFMAKGPAVLVPCGGMFAYLLLRREVWRYFGSAWSIAGLAIFIVTGLSWYIWVAHKVPGALHYFVDNQIMGRLVTEKYDRNPGLSGALIYVPVLIFGSLPWSAIWLEKRVLVRSSWANKQWWRQLPTRREPLFLLCSFVVPLVVLCLASSKLGLYALPIFAPLAIATARLWMQKAVKIEAPTFRGVMKSYRRAIALGGCWVCLLVLSRLALAHYPTRDDMRTLWSQIRGHLPAGGYELCTLDVRADGLLFYGARQMEHLTNEGDPYPTFSGTEHILQEVQEFVRTGENGLFLALETDEITEAIGLLRNAGIECRVVRLPHQRAMLFPYLTGTSSAADKRT